LHLDSAANFGPFLLGFGHDERDVGGTLTPEDSIDSSCCFMQLFYCGLLVMHRDELDELAWRASK
jgi:hypothetical protein